ncbi:hypothetical protein F5Y17DRAFT_469247 [Xylariaceae sp. FL0594]|nr:hypothetical protein F5Y17DRAFT_469247 [Xylariaceae sp. FL0594]
MVVQLPDGALAAAVGVQIYSHLCLVCSVVMILVVWKHHEKDSYVAILSVATCLSTAASIAQQLHTIIRWEDVKTEQLNYVMRHLGSPELIIAGPSYGLDLVLFYIQFYCYNVEGISTLFWAFALAFSVYCPSGHSRYQRISRTLAIVVKSIAVVLPAVLIGLLRIPAVRGSPALFLALADFILASSLLLGGILLIAILAKYIYTRRRMRLWMLPHHPSPPPQVGNPDDSGDGGEDGPRMDILEERTGGIYDSWLILRFAIAFVFLEAFQILNILSEIAQVNSNREEVLPDEPDLSAAYARGDFAKFLPGVSAGLLVFLVFGTTRTCIKTVYAMFLPRSLRRRVSGGGAGIGPDTLLPPPATNNNSAVWQGSTFLTTPRNPPHQQPSSINRRTPEPSSMSARTIERVAACRTRTNGRVTAMEPRNNRNRPTGSIEIQEQDIEACSISSLDACKLAQDNGVGGSVASARR